MQKQPMQKTDVTANTTVKNTAELFKQKVRLYFIL